MRLCKLDSGANMNPIVKSWLKGIIPSALRALTKNQGRSEIRLAPTFDSNLVRLPGGLKFRLRPTKEDHSVFQQVFLDNEYRVDGFPQGSSLQHTHNVHDQLLIIDAGANIGASAIWFSLTYPKAIILAVEPDAGNFELLKENCSAFPNITPINAALAPIAGSVFLFDPGKGDWGFRTSAVAVQGGRAVTALTIEDLIKLCPKARPFILKVDIEGAEDELFRTPSPSLSRFPLVAIEIHDWMLPGQANSQSFLRWHVDHKRDLLFNGENAFSFSTRQSNQLD